MLLPKGIPTLQSMVTKNWTRVDNVFATNNVEKYVVICDTDPRQWGPGTDHVPILTTLEFTVPAAAIEGQRNFRAVDWPKYREALSGQLGLMPDPCALTESRRSAIPRGGQ